MTHQPLVSGSGVKLSDEKHKQLWIPEGFALGFLTLEDNTHFLYKTTNYYAKDCERSMSWNDSDLAIDWRLESFESVSAS